MTLLRLARFSLRQSKVPRNFFITPQTNLSTTAFRTNHWLLDTPSVVVNSANAEISSLRKTKVYQPLLDLNFEESYNIYQELIKKLSDKQYAEIVPILSNYKKKKKVLSNPHLLSFISLLLHVKEINLKGIAYEVFLLYSLEILSDIKGYPNDLLEILLDVLFYYKDNTNFDVLFSQYLNSPVLDEKILEKALHLYIENSNIELAKQLLYQVITYHSQNGVEISPKVLEVFLRKMIQNNANYNNIEFGYKIWIQQGHLVTSTINDLMLVALVKNQETIKLNIFTAELMRIDPKILTFNNILKNANQVSPIELKQSLDGFIKNVKGEETHFYTRIIELINNIHFLIEESYSYFHHNPSLYLLLADKISLTTNVEELAHFLETKVIPLGIFNYRFLKLFCDAYITNFPDAAKQIDGAYQTFLSNNYDPKTVYWYSELSDIGCYQYKHDYKLIKPSKMKVMKLLGRIGELKISLQEKVQLLSNNFSRLGIQSDDLIYRYLLSNYEKPSHKNPENLQLAEKYLLRLSSPENKLKTDLVILKKRVRLQFDDPHTNPITRLENQNDLIFNFLEKYRGSLDKKSLCTLSDIYISLKEFDISERILEQVKEMHLLESHRSKKLEERNYDELVIARMELKQVILSHNYPRIIEEILIFRKRDDIVVRRFFIKLLQRDLQYLRKYKMKLQGKELKTVDEMKETLVVEKLCIYLEDFIKELSEQHKGQTISLIRDFESKLLKYKDYCK